MNLPRSIIAVGAALGAALAVQAILLASLKLAAPSLAGITGRTLTIAFISSYLLGTVLPAIAAGVALGRLAPMKPSVHVSAVGLLSPLIGYLLAGPVALPHGWQIVGYGIQLMLIEFVTLRVFRTQGRPPTRFSTRPA